MLGKIFTIVLLFLLAGPSGAAAERPLRLAPLALEDRETMAKSFCPLAEYLGKRSGREVELVFFADYDAMLDAFLGNELDIAFLGPLPYLQLRRRGAQLTPLMGFREADGSARYRCVLIARGAERLTPADLRGRPIGLTQPRSTCGYLGTNAILRDQAGFTLEETAYRYLGSHEDVVLAVAAGQVVAGGVKEYYADKYAPLDIAVIGYAGWLPPFVLAANRQTMTATAINNLQTILQQTAPETYRNWGSHLRHGMVLASEEDFDELADYGDPDTIPHQTGQQTGQ